MCHLSNLGVVFSSSFSLEVAVVEYLLIMTESIIAKERLSFRDSTLSRRPRAPLDYSSDTEATIGSRSLSYYQRRGLTSGLNAISRVGTTPVSSLRSNSLPRDHRGRSHVGPVPRQSLVRFDRNLSSSLLGDDDSDGALSAPELPSRRERGMFFIFSTSSAFFVS